MIKYHRNGTGNDYGSDGKLTNNWDPDADYGEDYINVYFRVESELYRYPEFRFKGEDRTVFYDAVRNALEPLGWSGTWDCGYVYKGKQSLYLHPQNFSGEVRKNDIRSIAEALARASVFQIRWVDLYRTVYDISDHQYRKILDTKRAEIKSYMFSFARTKRTNQYVYTYDLVLSAAEKYRTDRLGKDWKSDFCITYCRECLAELFEDGYLVSPFDRTDLCRSLNKTEMRRARLKEI